MTDVYEKLKKEIAYAKRSYSIKLLYQAHGAVCMAFDLNALTKAQFMELESECIRKGINNPEIFNNERCDIR